MLSNIFLSHAFCHLLSGLALFILFVFFVVEGVTVALALVEMMRIVEKERRMDEEEEEEEDDDGRERTGREDSSAVLVDEARM